MLLGLSATLLTLASCQSETIQPKKPTPIANPLNTFADGDGGDEDGAAPKPPKDGSGGGGGGN